MTKWSETKWSIFRIFGNTFIRLSLKYGCGVTFKISVCEKVESRKDNKSVFKRCFTVPELPRKFDPQRSLFQISDQILKNGQTGYHSTTLDILSYLKHLSWLLRSEKIFDPELLF